MEQTMKGRLFLYGEQGYEGPPWAFQDERYITRNETTFLCTRCHLFWNRSKHKTVQELISFWREYYKKSIKNLQRPGRGNIKKKELKEDRQRLVSQLRVYVGCDHVWQKTSNEHWSHEGLHVLELGDRLKVVRPWPGNPKILFDDVLKFGASSGGPMPFWYPKMITKEQWYEFFKEPKLGDYILKTELTPSAPAKVKMAVHRLMPGHSLVEIIDHRPAENSRLFKDGVGYITNILFYFANPSAKPVGLGLAFTPKQYWCSDKSHGQSYCICKRLPEHFIDQIILPFGQYQPRARFSNKKGVPARLIKALDKYISSNCMIVIRSFEKNYCGGLFSFKAVVACRDREGSEPVVLDMYFQNRSVVCGCAYKRDKIGRWRRAVKKEERICICRDLPEDIMTNMHPVRAGASVKD